VCVQASVCVYKGNTDGHPMLLQAERMWRTLWDDDDDDDDDGDDHDDDDHDDHENFKNHKHKNNSNSNGEFLTRCDHIVAHRQHQHVRHAALHYASHVTLHMSHVTRHTSHVTRHTTHCNNHESHITHYLSHVTVSVRLFNTAPVATLQSLPSPLIARANSAAQNTLLENWGLGFGVWGLGFGVWGLKV